MKTVAEWSEKFDLYYNNIASNQAPGLDEYEKSVFLSDAQRQVVLSLYNGTLGQAFESTEIISNYLAPLVRDAHLTESSTFGIGVKGSALSHTITGCTVTLSGFDLVKDGTYDVTVTFIAKGSGTEVKTTTATVSSGTISFTDSALAAEWSRLGITYTYSPTPVKFDLEIQFECDGSLTKQVFEIEPAQAGGSGTLKSTSSPRMRISGENSHLYQLPSDLLARTYEDCLIDTGSCGDRRALVQPVTQDEYWRTSRNPFKGAGKTRVLRLADADTASTKYSELVSEYDIKEYYVRYICNPEPIILEDLSSSGLSIDGQTGVATCKLDEALHDVILSEAVTLAKAAWISK